MAAASFEKPTGRPAKTRDQARSHVIAGIALTIGAVLVSAVVAARNAPSPRNRKLKPEPAPPKRSPAVFSVVWPPLFLALTLSGLRIWNAPPSPARTRALTLWGLVQAFNAAWMALGPRRLGGQVATAVASLGAATAYAWQARRIDAPASNLAAPYLGWIGFANVLTEELWRRSPHAHTVH